jgi:hypothetical protein
MSTAQEVTAVTSRNRGAELVAGVGLTSGLALAAHFTESEALILPTAGVSVALIAVGLLCLQAGNSMQRSATPASTPLMEAVNDMTNEELSRAIVALHANQVAMATAGRHEQAQMIAQDKFACLEAVRQRRAATDRRTQRHRHLIAATVAMLIAVGMAVGLVGSIA